VIVHLVTDRRRLAGTRSVGLRADRRRRSVRLEADDADCLLTQVGFAIAAGVDIIQVRERDLDALELCALVTEIVRRTRGTNTRVIVNDRVDVAIACVADGVHLRSDSVPADRVRRIAPPRFVIGRSVHGAAEAREVSAGVDYLVAGTVWATGAKPPDQQLLGIEGLRAVVASVNVPVVAIGGITVDRAPEVARAGAAGVAAIGLFQAVGENGCRAVGLEKIVDRLRRSFDTLSSGP
jgi:thiamine-phosphate pyrophosphorylase